MFKKRLKGLLAMALAGSLALTALPLTASATISGEIDVVGGGTVNPNDIICTSGVYSFEGSSYDAISGDLGSNYLWAIYAEKGGTESGYIITTAKGDKLAAELYGLNESSTEYENVKIKNSHKVLVTTDDPSVTDTPVSGAEDVSYFPHEISLSNVGFTPINSPLQEATWTVWYGAEFGNTVDSGSADKGASYAISAGSTEIEIPMSTVENIYKPVSGGSTIPFGLGVTIIQLQNSYKTFEIPVYNGWGEATNQKISVTETNTDSALKDLNGAALKGKYVLVYDETQYNNNSNYIINKDDLWSVIEDVADEKGTFDVSKAKLVRYVKYDAVIGYFTSVDLLNDVRDNRDINYLNERKTSGSIWKLYCEVIGPTGLYTYPNKFVYGDSFDAEIKEFLNEYNCDTVSLRNKTMLHITATDPSTQVNQYGGFKLEITEDVKQYITIDTDKQYPVKVSDLAAKLTAEIRPTAGMKYNKDEWELWPCYTSTGLITMVSKATVADPAADIGITHYELALEQQRNDLLVYFKQVAIAPAVTVTAPVVGASPVTTATVPENDGYFVVEGSVKWSDGDTELTSAAKFEGGKQYTVTVTLKPETGLAFTDNTVVTINGEAPTAKNLNQDDGTLTVSYKFAAIQLTEITSAALTVTAPKLGETPNTTATPETGANYTASAVTWSPAADKFAADTKYKASVTLTPNSGYKFAANTTAKINGNTAAVTVNNDGSATVSYEFAAIQLTEITSAALTVTAPRPGRPSGPRNPIINGIEMTWSEAAVYLTNLQKGSEVIINLNGNSTVPADSVKAIADRKLKTTFIVDSVKSWITDGADITNPAAADLSIPSVNKLTTDALRGISGVQFTMNNTNIPTDLTVAFKTEHAGKFANLYKVVDGKLTFVTCAKVGADGKVTLSDVTEKGEYVAMLFELSDRMGDMNNDGILNAMDAAAILKEVVDLESGKNPLMADFDGNGKVNALDAAAILKRIVGLA